MNSARLRVSGLYAGIGGFERGLEGAGHQAVLLCDNSPYASRVLRHRWPDVRLRTDVSGLQDLPSDTDVVTAGFPCQDLSMVGGKSGLKGKKSRVVKYLFDLLKRHPVPWVIIENVYFMLHLDKGSAIGKILDDLEALHYRWAYRVVDSRSFGLAQRRRRVFIVAALDGDPRSVLLADDVPDVEWPAIDMAKPIGFYWTEGRVGHGLTSDAIPPLKAGSGLSIPSPPAVLLPSGRVVTPPIEAAERLQGFPARWTCSLRSDAQRRRWHLVGNAVSVPVARWLGERLLVPGSYDSSADHELEEGSRWPRAGWNVEGHKMVAQVSERPIKVTRGRLSSFATENWPDLSERALRGFARRVRQSNLRYPAGFQDAIEKELSKRC